MMSPAARPASNALISFAAMAWVALRRLIPLQAICERMCVGELIVLAAEQLRAASGEAITFVPDISALSVHEQAAVLQQCWDGIRMIVGCTLESEQINRFICEGKLNEALLYRLRNCEIDLRRARPFAG